MAIMQIYGGNNMGNNNIFALLWPYIWSKQSAMQKIKFIVFVLGTILTTLMVISVPWLLKQVIIALETKKTNLYLALIIIVIMYGCAWMITKIIDRLRHQAACPMIANMIHKLCLDLFAHLQHLSMLFHHDRKSGQIFNIVSRTRYAIVGFTQSIAQEIIPIFLQIVLASMLLTYYYGVQYGMILLLMLLLYMILSIKTANIIVTRRREQNKTDGAANAFIVDSLLNAETVKYFGMEKYEAEQAKDLLVQKQEADILSLMGDAKVHLLQTTIIGIAVISLTMLSGVAVFNNQLHVSDFVMINSFVLMFMAPLNSLGYRYRTAKLQLTHLESAFELLKEPVEIIDAAHATPLQFKSGLIEFKQVTFGYKSDRIILKNVSFTVKPGSNTAIVGASGSGKSTIPKLIFRFYDVTSGEISIDGQNIKDITRDSLCDIIGIVPQDTVMFNDSIKNNIIYSQKNIKDNLEKILKDVELKEFVDNLPAGIDTVIGERGLKLSGGERQRLAIARLLARDPKIMIFDEATSALDLITEKKIQQCLFEVSAGLTTIIIAHRLSTIRHADNIIVLDNGEIAEQGTHEELLSKNGVYAKLLAKGGY
jgi:ATP-binding cassette subfamily B protein